MERNNTNKCNCQMFGTTSPLSRTQKLNEDMTKKKNSSSTTNTTKETTKETTTTFCTVLYFFSIEI